MRGAAARPQLRVLAARVSRQRLAVPVDNVTTAHSFDIVGVDAGEAFSASRSGARTFDVAVPALRRPLSRGADHRAAEERKSVPRHVGAVQRVSPSTRAGPTSSICPGCSRRRGHLTARDDEKTYLQFSRALPAVEGARW